MYEYIRILKLLVTLFFLLAILLMPRSMEALSETDPNGFTPAGEEGAAQVNSDAVQVNSDTADNNEQKQYIDKETAIFNEYGDQEPICTIAPQTVIVIEQRENWLLIETWLGEKWIDLDYVRSSVLLDVPAYNQRELGLYSGCEIVSLGMMINYTVDIDIQTLVTEMPRSDDPNLGFRGDPTSLRDGFTIFPPALMELTGKYLGQAKDMTGCNMDDLKNQLNSNCPIVVWVDGLGFNVHAVCLTGYDGEGFFYNDPWYGSKNASISYDQFYSIWNKPIYDEDYYFAYPVRQALSYSVSE